MDTNIRPQSQLDINARAQRPESVQQVEPSMPTCCCFPSQNGLITWLVLGIVGSMIVIIYAIASQQPLICITQVISVVLSFFGIYAIATLDVLKMEIFYWLDLLLIATTIAVQLLVFVPQWTLDACQRQMMEERKTINCELILQSVRIQYYIAIAIIFLVQAWIFYKLLQFIRWAESSRKGCNQTVEA